MFKEQCRCHIHSLNRHHSRISTNEHSPLLRIFKPGAIGMCIPLKALSLTIALVHTASSHFSRKNKQKGNSLMSHCCSYRPMLSSTGEFRKQKRNKKLFHEDRIQNENVVLFTFIINSQ